MRAPSYHEAGAAGFHGQLRDLLLANARPSPGSAVADMCAGTGIVSLAAAEAVGPTGVVVGVDFAERMIDEGRRYVKKMGYDNRISFTVGDVENPTAISTALAASGRPSFDVIYCSAAAVWFDALPETLRMWRRFLRPGGTVAINGWSENSFVAGAILQEVSWGRGWYQVPNWHGPTSSPAKCRALMEECGFRNPSVSVANMSGTRQAAELKSGFDRLLANTPSKQEKSVLLGGLFTKEEKEELRQSYFARVDELADETGVVPDPVLTYTIVATTPHA